MGKAKALRFTLGLIFSPGILTRVFTLSCKHSQALMSLIVSFRKNTTYITVYTLWLRLIFTAALPFTLMLFFNLMILLYYRRNR